MASGTRPTLTSAGIVMVGDSFVEGTTIPHAELPSSLLGNLHRKVVANLAIHQYLQSR